MKKLFSTLILLAIGLALVGCGLFEENDNCQDAINDMKSKYGPPEDVSSTVSGSTGYYQYMYYSQGLAFSFTTDGKTCDKYTSNYSPIRKEVILKAMGFENYTGSK